jgi:hypothetical protein
MHGSTTANPRNAGKYRLTITYHFDAVISEIDASTERELQAAAECDNDELEHTIINARRDTLLGEVNAAQKTNLTNFEDNILPRLDVFNELDERTQLTQLFRVFCFTVEFRNVLRLIVTDMFLTTEQLRMFKSLVHYNYPANSILNFSTDMDFYSEIFDLSINRVSKYHLLIL